jgi:hypothetical protein
MATATKPVAKTPVMHRFIAWNLPRSDPKRNAFVAAPPDRARKYGAKTFDTRRNQA